MTGAPILRGPYYMPSTSWPRGHTVSQTEFQLCRGSKSGEERRCRDVMVPDICDYVLGDSTAGGVQRLGAQGGRKVP